LSIYPRAELDTFAFGHTLGFEEVSRGLDRLVHLQHLYRAGYWNRLTESNVEQSFVERVFGEVFGYATLLGDGGPEHEVLPKMYVALPDAKRAFPDFALGFFRADQTETVVTAELKGPDADLDAPQGGNYGGSSPVQQAMQAAIAAGAVWCIVSNTNELRLYHVPDDATYERVFLLDVVSPNDFRRAHALFSRRCLLGREKADPSPLSRFHNHIAAGESMLVEKRPNRIRLVQRIRPANTHGREFAFTRLSAALRDAQQGGNTDFERPRLEHDRLISERLEANGRSWHRVAVVKSGLLVCSYSVPLDYPENATTISVDPGEIASLLSEMTIFGWRFFETLAAENPLVYEWSLEDLSVQVQLNDTGQWAKPPCFEALKCMPTVDRMSAPEIQFGRPINRATVQTELADAVRELFFPFERMNDENKRCRLEPSDAALAGKFSALVALDKKGP
jgi:hypothetical protein